MDFEEIDELSLFFGDDYHLNDSITIHQPTVGEIAEFGEKRYWYVVNTLTSTPSDMISVLWDKGIDWEQTGEFELFYSFICQILKPEDTSILLGDLRLCDFKLFRDANDEIIMRNADGAIIDTNIYRIMVDVIRKIHGLRRNVRKAGNSFTKDFMIEVDRADREAAARKPFESQLKNYVSAMINSEGFKYGLQETRNMPYMAFKDSVRRIVAIKRAATLNIGSVCGMADLSKIPRNTWDWLRDLNED